MKQKTDGEFQFKFGRMVKGLSSLLLDENQISDSQNMVPTQAGWKQRKGMSELTTSAIAASLRLKTMVQYRDLEGDTDVLLAHVYEAVNGERLMKQTTIPPAQHTGASWESLYDLSAACENLQHSLVAGAWIGANDKEFLVWRGNQHLPSGVWLYLAGSYIDFFDELTDKNSSTSMPLNSMIPGDYAYVTAPMPMDEVILDIGDVNGTDVFMIGEYFNGVWTILKQASWWCDATNIDEDCSSLTTWSDDDGGDGNTTQVTFKGKECFRLDAETAGAGNIAAISKDFGSWASGAMAISLLCYHDNLGTSADVDTFYIKLERSDGSVSIRIATDGVYIYEGGWNQADATAVAEGEWILWTFVVDFSTPASATVDCWKNGVSLFTNEGCSNENPQTDGNIIISNRGETTAHQITHIAQIAVGTAIDATANGFADGTYASGMLAQDGSITWTPPGDEVKTLVEGTPGYAFRFGPSAILDASVSILNIDVHTPMDTFKALWSGQYRTVTGCYVYDGTDHTDYTLYVGNTVENQYMNLSAVTTTDKIYVGFPFRTNNLTFHPATDGKNTGNVSITAVKYHSSGGLWASVGTVVDTMETNDATFSQKGTLSWADPGRYVEKMTTVGGDTIPWFWYEITVDAALDSPTYIYYIEAIPIDDDPDPCFGCFGWKRRAWQIAPRNRKNQVRYSAENLIDIWGGFDSGYIEFGERPLKSATPFYNETVLFADTEMWMLQGNSPANFGKLRLSASIGTAAPHGTLSIDTGVQVGESIKNVIVFLFYDGFWMFDGVRLMKISSPDIDTFFDPDEDDYINPAKLGETQAVFDHDTQCAMWSVYSGSSASTPTKVLVLHFPTLWYGIFDYGTDIGAMCKVYNDRYYTIGGGDTTGKCYLLNTGLTDENVSGAAVAVDAYVISRDMFASYSDGLQQRLISIWVEAQEAGGLVEIDEYADGSKTPQNILKKDMSWYGKLFGIIQKPLRKWGGQKTSKFRIRNRSKNARMNLLGFSTTIDKGRADE